MTVENEVIVPAPDLNAPEPPDPTLNLPPNLPPVETPAPVIEPVVAPVELRYEYQPTDEHGRALGGKQVIKYSTPDELAERLRDQNIELVRKLREVTRKQRLGLDDDEALPENLERLPKVVEFKERPLTLDERYALSQDLNDPEKFETARDKLFESATGVNPKDFREQQNQQQFTVQQLLARANAQVFFETHPDFYVCTENVETVTDWMIKKGLQPTVKNFETAHSKLQEAGLLFDAPIVREAQPPVQAAPVPAVENTVLNPQVPVEQVARISEPEQPQAKRQVHVPSGLNSRIASNTGVIPVTKTLTLAEIDRMPSDEYKRRLQTDPKFVEDVNALASKQPPKPRRA